MKKFSIALIVAVLLGVGIYLYSQYKKAMGYCYKINIANTKIFSLSKSLVKMTLALDFKNKSDFDLIISGYIFDILVNGSRVAVVKHSGQQLIKANAFSPFNIEIEFSPVDVFKDNKPKLAMLVADIVANKKNVVFRIAGFVSGAALGLEMKDRPVEMTLTLAEIMAPSESTEKCK